jgi:hypothetical protein
VLGIDEHGRDHPDGGTSGLAVTRSPAQGVILLFAPHTLDRVLIFGRGRLGSVP